MVRKRLPTVPATDDSVAQRIATGLHKVGLAMKQQSWQQANDEGLSATQGQILAALVGHGALTGTELGTRLGLTLPTISESVRVLGDKALVKKERDPRHPRASLIVLTARGRALGVRARSWPEYLADAVSTLAQPEQAAFFAGIVKMLRVLQEQGLVPTDGMCVTCTHFRPHVHAGARPHHCALIDAKLADVSLRLDCPDHVLAAAEARQALWARFTQPD